MPLKSKEDPETKYVVDMLKMGSPTKKTANKIGTNGVLYTQAAERKINVASD